MRLRVTRRVRTVILPVLVIVAAASAAAAFRSQRADFSQEPEAPVERSPAPVSSPLPENVVTVRPALKASVPTGISRELVEQVRTVAGVGAAARVLLSTLEIDPQGGMSELTVAGVEPDAFRPLTPDATAQAKFVWEGLLESKAFVANEEYQMLGGEPILQLRAHTPGGRTTIRIGGVATNGVPSLAGALMSLDHAEQLGLGTPSLLIVGMSPEADISVVTQGLAKVLPGVQFQNMLPPSGRTFYSGPAAQKAIGTFIFTANPDGTIRQNSKWVNQNLASARMPIIGNVRCHKLMLPQLRFALEEIQSSGLADLIEPAQTGRCYQPRYVAKDPTHQLSKHAWGLAIDLNVYDNPEGSKPTMDPRIVAIFERWGFRWGGRWTKPDGMHFELAALLKQ